MPMENCEIMDNYKKCEYLTPIEVASKEQTRRYRYGKKMEQ